MTETQPSPSARRMTRLEGLAWLYNTDLHPKDQGKYKLLITRELSGSDDLSLGVGWLVPGEIHILHHHPDAAEFYYILGGYGKVTVDDEVFDTGPGTAIYIPTGAKHRIENDGPETMIVLFAYNRPEYQTVWDE